MLWRCPGATGDQLLSLDDWKNLLFHDGFCAQCNVCLSFGALDNYAGLVFRSRRAAILENCNSEQSGLKLCFSQWN